LREIETKQGVLAPTAHNLHAFSHRILQEYLAACYFKATGVSATFAATHFLERHWQRVCILLAGMDGADELVEAMGKAFAWRLATSRRFCKLLVWAQEVTQPSQDSEFALARRLAALTWVRYVDLAGRRPRDEDGALLSVLDHIWIPAAVPAIDWSNFFAALTTTDVPATKLHEFVQAAFMIFRHARLFKVHVLESVQTEVQRVLPRLTKNRRKVNSAGCQLMRRTILRAVKFPGELWKSTAEDVDLRGWLSYGYLHLLVCRSSATKLNSTVWHGIVSDLLSCHSGASRA
jgi:hypothetical protein